MQHDYYKILGVDRTASTSEIKARYRQLVKRHHPDRRGDTRTMALINEAYSALSDPLLRHQYNLSIKQPSQPSPKPKQSQSNFTDYIKHEPEPKQATRKIRPSFSWAHFAGISGGIALATILAFIVANNLPNKANSLNTAATPPKQTKNSNVNLSAVAAQQRAKVLQQQTAAENSAAQQIQTPQPTSTPSQQTNASTTTKKHSHKTRLYQFFGNE